ncbi:MAG: hypothetical protein U0Z44_07030 [Kouleothrix sp.]|jgi:AraC-like DNA-binding protein|nr:hypothetical protein [Kouleothrix sp.]
MDDATRNQTLQRLDELWHMRPQPGGATPAHELAARLTQRLLGSMIAQQNAFNAAVVHAFQALAANDDRRHSELLGQIQNLHVQLTSLARRVELIERHLADADDADTALAARLVELERQLGEARPA